MYDTYYLWLDFETTGLDEFKDKVIEVAAILTDDGFRELQVVNQLISLPPGYAHWEEWSDKFVVDMHKKSGLYKDWNAAVAGGTATNYLDAEDLICDMLPVGGKVILAGSGVSHFDFRFIRRYMPALAERLFWCPLDVGQIEEWLKVSGRKNCTYDEMKPSERARKTHRALDDIRYHLDEGRFYMSIFGHLPMFEVENG